tara:strand:- start:1783 stop:2046 length:264 start_codon:yes stop_codon:yes gene_type:complete
MNVRKNKSDLEAVKRPLMFRFWKFIDKKLNGSYTDYERLNDAYNSTLKVEIKSNGVKLDINSLLENDEVTRQVRALDSAETYKIAKT